MGPLVNFSGLEKINSQVKGSIKEGAQILTDGEQIERKGYFYKPPVLKKVTTKMRIAQEEVFGPIAQIIVSENGLEALKIANDSVYGLGASLRIGDPDEAEKFSKMIQFGVVSINNVVASDSRVPFGGIKNSGFGEESCQDIAC